jgi:hypothetical protein
MMNIQSLYTPHPSRRNVQPRFVAAFVAKSQRTGPPPRHGSFLTDR